MALKTECDRCGKQQQLNALGGGPQGWARLKLEGSGVVTVRNQTIDICDSCVHAARGFMERLPVAVEKAS